MKPEELERLYYITNNPLYEVYGILLDKQERIHDLQNELWSCQKDLEELKERLD